MEDKRPDIYDYEIGLENAVNALKKNTAVTSDNKQLILRFHNLMVAMGRAKLARQTKIIRQLTKLATLAGSKVINDFTKDDVIQMLAKFESNHYSDWTRSDYRLTTKKFFQWLRNCEDGVYPHEVRWIKNLYPKSNLSPDQLLSEEEVKAMVDAADHPRDKALIFVLYDSGCRIGELLTLRIKDVETDTAGAVLNVTGKTGKRRVRLIQSVPLLSAWLAFHPFGKNPNACLWIRFESNRYTHAIDTPIRPSWTGDLIKKIAIRAGIKKRVYPHLFRHSRATYLARFLPEPLLKKQEGWSKSSDMTSTYVHLSDQDLDNAMKRIGGIKVEEEEKKSVLNVVNCVRCRTQNSATSKFCSSCGFCFDLNLSIQLDQAKTKIDELFTAIVSDPQKLEVMLKLVQSMH